MGGNLRGLGTGLFLCGVIILLLFLLIMPAVLQLAPTGAQASGEEGYWKQTDVTAFPYESTENTEYSISDGSSTYSHSLPDVGDRFQSSATWSSPAATYKGGEKVELTLQVKVDTYVWTGGDESGYLHLGLNHAGDSISASIDAAGLQSGITRACIDLTDKDGKSAFSVVVDTGEKVVSSDGGTVSAEFPAGYDDGEEKAIYVKTAAGMVRYTYSWTAGPEPDVVSPDDQDEEGVEPEDSESDLSTYPSEYQTVEIEGIEPEDSGCRFASFRGEVEFLPPGGGEDDWQFARLNVKILAGTRIRTAEESSAILHFADLSTFVLKSETEIIIRAKPKQISNFDLVTGRLWVNIKRILKGDSIVVRTDRSVTGVEGTIFVLEDDGRTSTLKVIDGKVEFTAISDGENTTVEAGETVSATADGLGEIKTFDIDTEQAEWDEVISETEAGSGQDGFPVWLLILIILIVVAIITAVAAILARGRKRGRADIQSPEPVGQHVQAMANEFHGAICPRCGSEQQQEGMKFCMKCGTPLADPRQQENQLSFCPGCGNRLQEGTRFCRKCGRPL
ncbi:MAG: zinc-ribbon domain-containing protein [Actinobacteria bacterium]|nr:zinc-ribbon domain-containing protein [Actinomycetota bacterium]